MPRPYASTIMSATADEVWAYLRDFANFAEWHPRVETSSIEEGGITVGCVRRLVGPGGEVFRELLVAFSDIDRSYTYEYLESPLPLRSFRATMRVAPVTDIGQAFVEWWAWYDADAKDEPSVTKVISRAVMATGLASLRKRFDG